MNDDSPRWEHFSGGLISAVDRLAVPGGHLYRVTRYHDRDGGPRVVAGLDVCFVPAVESVESEIPPEVERRLSDLEGDAHVPVRVCTESRARTIEANVAGIAEDVIGLSEELDGMRTSGADDRS